IRPNGVVAGEIDPGDAGALTFVDGEDDADTAIGRGFGAGRHGDGIEAIAVISLANALNISIEPLLAENARCGHIDHGQKLTVREPAIALEEHGCNQLLLRLRSHDAKDRHAGGHGGGPQNGDRGNRATHQLGGVNHIVIAFCDRPEESPCTALPQANSMELFYCFFNQEQGVCDHAVSNSLAHLYSCNTLRTKVNKGLAQNPKMVEYGIIEQRKDHQRQHKSKTEPESQLLDPEAQGSASDGLDQIIQQMAAIQHG